MNSRFYNLLDNTIAEISRREPGYTALFPIGVLPKEMAPNYSGHPSASLLPQNAIHEALSEGLSYVAKRWPKGTQPSTQQDPVAQLLCDSIFDALCADQGLIGLLPYNAVRESSAAILSRQYSKRHSPDGICYYVRNSGGKPLLLVNATGIPVAIWNEFLADDTHDFRIILPQRRGSDLFRGGLREYVDIKKDSADLCSILDAESLEETNVLAWCHGARVALDLAIRRARQISSMILLGPVTKGIQGLAPIPSNFERDLEPLLHAVAKDASLASFLSKSISNHPTSPDWSRWTDAPANRARALFAMPAKDHACDMMAPLTDPQSFINMVRRLASDESYPLHDILKRLETRTMVIMGSDDNIVSNELASSAMKQMCKTSMLRVMVQGSGHYIQDLQYHYFRWFLKEFLERGKKPENTARIRVEELVAA